MTDENHPEDEPLNIEIDDLEEEADEPLPPADDSESEDTLVIELEDLDEDIPAAGPSGAAGKSYPAVGGGSAADLKAKSKKSAAAAIFGNLMLQMFVAGLIGGVLAWFINEPWTTDTVETDPTRIYIHSVIFFAIVGALIGTALGALEGLLTGAYGKMAQDAGIALMVGAAGGAAAGFLGQYAYAAIGGTSPTVMVQIMSRTVGWSIAGMMIGVAQGVRYMDFQRFINGFIGGAVGGFVGGILFDVIGTIIGGGEVSRLVGLAVIGAATGAAIGLLEEVRKEAWVTIVDGPLTGKEFIIYQRETTIGSAGYCDIPLMKDPHVAPEHVRLVMQGTSVQLENLVGPEAVLVNEQPVSRHVLSDGDLIHIGSTVFHYQDRAVE